MDAKKAVEILSPLAGTGELVQTHASIVYITPEFVYKIKKPVDFGFLNYTQMKQRRAFSILEKELNSRYSEGIYLEVLKIIERDGGYALVPLENTLPAVEYVLKMKRIPDGLFLSNRLNGMSPEQMESIGAHIARRLSTAEKAPEIVDNLGVFEQIDFNCKENFFQLEESAKHLLDKRFDYIKKTTLDFLDKNKDLFLKRHAEGYVKDGHGDLRLEHVYIQDDTVGLIDLIEFNNRFRMNDVVSEAAFMSMELDYYAEIDLSDAFLRGFFSVYSDAESAFLLNFYRCYRAVVRAKVAMFTAAGLAEGSEGRCGKINEYHRMMDMAVIYAFSSRNMRPVALCGMIASGKSFCAKAFGKRFPVKGLNTDEERKRLAGIGLLDSGVTTYHQGLYTEENSAKVYAMMGTEAAKAMQTGRLPLADGTFIKKSFVESFNASVPVKPIYIEVITPEEDIIRRLKEREGQKSVSDGRLHHYEKMKDRADSIPRDAYIDGREDAYANVNKILELLLNV